MTPDRRGRIDPDSQFEFLDGPFRADATDMRVPREFSEDVLFLFREVGGEVRPWGTAFAVYVEEVGRTFAYFVTARHVVEDGVGSRYSLRMRYGAVPHRGVPAKVGPAPDDWHFHPDPSIDLAVAPPSPTATGWGRVGAVELSSAARTEKQLSDLGLPLIAGDEVFLVGMFAQELGVTENLRFTRYGHVSAVSDERLASIVGGDDAVAKHHYLEIQAWPGFSGSPVWLRRPAYAIDEGETQRVIPEQFHLIGSVSGYFPERPGDEATQAGGHFGLSLVVPIERLIEVIHGEELTRLRQKARAANRPHPASRATLDIHRKGKRVVITGPR